MTAIGSLNPESGFGQYRIIRLLGRGGMGEVYEAEHRVLERRYALKLLPDDFASRLEAVRRFEREAKVMANLEHPHIVRVDEFGQTDGRYWLRMELVKGIEARAGGRGPKAGSGLGENCVTLEAYAAGRGGRLEQGEYAVILKQVLEALAYAHGKGVVHRDLKPGNILLERDAAGGLRVRVSDFGLARVLGEEFLRIQAEQSVARSLGGFRTVGGLGSLREARTREEAGSSTRALLGTWDYMSPEQKRGEEADARSDVYAVGLICYRLLTGEELGMEKPSEARQDVSPVWDMFVARAVKPNPSDRYASGADMLAASEPVVCAMTAAEESERQEALRRAQEERQRREAEAAAERQREAQPVAARAQAARAEEARAQRQQRHRKLRKRLAWAGGLLALVAVCLGAWYWGSYLPAQKREEAATAARLAAGKEPGPALNSASRDHPWENSLGMKFVPVAGTAVLFGVWDVRVKDFRAFAQDRAGNGGWEYEKGSAPYILKSGEVNRWGWEYGWSNPGFAQRDEHPVVCVSWEDAKAFCAWLTWKERAEGRIGAGQCYRLPTVAEWSVAVGLPTESGATPKEKDGKIPDVYPWGRGLPPPSGAGNYAGIEARDRDWPADFDTIKGYRDGYARTSPVGSFKANQYGLYDMGGNVWQWCEDYYDGQSGSRVLRGASWGSDYPDHLLSSYRLSSAPDLRYNNVGFRCVLEGGSSP